MTVAIGELGRCFSRRFVIRDLTAATVLGAAAVISKAEALPKAANGDENAIRAALQRWRALYSYGSKPFTFAGFEDLYDSSDELLAFDKFSPDTRTEGWQAYRRLWEPLINASFSEQRIMKLDIKRLSVSGDMAWSAIELWFTARREGKPFSTSQYGTHVWRRAAGGWRIVHEHMTGPVKTGGHDAKP